MSVIDFTFILLGVGIGVLLAAVMHSMAKSEEQARRERGVLHSVGERARPEASFFVENDDNYETEAKLRPRLDELRTDPKESFHATFTDAGAYNWIVHSEYHLSLWLLGEWLQYWPTKSKWRWNHRTYTGDVNAFIEEQVREVRSSAQET